MGKRIIMGALALAMFFLVSGTKMPEQVQAAEASQTTYTGKNVNAQNYSVWSSVVNSALVETADGQLMRFQADALDGYYVVEYYDSSTYHLKKTVTVAKELSLFGAFYDDGTNYYVLSGQKNPDESDDVEVYRLTKYDHQWNRISSAGLFGANTYAPFDGGSARIASDGNLLFVRTCHEMYNGHQANVTIEFNTADMTVVDSYTVVSNISAGYVSHSFNQFIKLDEGKIVGVDHGDAYPRGVTITKYKSEYTSSGFAKSCIFNVMPRISGNVGANATGVSVGGFEISSDNYLVAGNMVTMDDNYSASGTRNIFVSSVDKELSGDPVIHTITSYAEGDTSPSTPQFVKLSTDSYLLMWMKDDVLNYCKINGSGEKVGEIYTMKDGKLSDCVPIVTNGKLVWYTWENETTDFYEINLTDLTKTNAYQGYDGHIVVITDETISTDTEVGKTLEIKCIFCDEVLSLQKWLIDANGKLTVDGNTDIARTSGNITEWYEYRDRIKTAEIKGTGMTNLALFFYGCSNLTSVDVSGLDTSKVTKMHWMFKDCSSLKSLDLSSFDTSNVTNMAKMFFGCSSLTTLNIKGFQTGSVTDMGSMFYNCRSLTSLDVSEFDTGSATSMTLMFYRCSSLTSLDVSGFNTGNVKYMDYMFDLCSSLTSLDLSGFDAANVTNMAYMLYGCSSLTTIKAPKNVSCDADLPEVGTNESWKLSDGTVVTALPKNLSKSVEITRKTQDATKLTTKNTTVTLSKTSYTYDGKTKKPTVTVYDSKSKKISSKYYTVKYSNNTKVGKATLTITFKDKYTGTIKKTFKINPAATTISKVTSAKTKTLTVKWKKQTTQTTGYEIQYATDKKFTKNKKTVTVSSAKTTSTTITKLSAKKKYYVRIRTYKTVDGTKYYSAWSDALSVKTK